MEQKTTGNYEMCRVIKHSAPTVLAILSGAGMIFTVVSAVKATPKALLVIEETEKERGRELTKSEKVKCAAPCYIPTFFIGISTLACLLGSCVTNRKQQAAYVGAYTMIEDAYRSYKDKTAELYGDGAVREIKAENADDKARDFGIEDCETCVFYEEYRGEFFESTKEQVLLAEYHFNRNFALRDYAYLNEFYEFLGLPRTEQGDVLGWEKYIGETEYGYSWIDFEHEKRKLDDGMEYYIISMPFEPTMIFEET